MGKASTMKRQRRQERARTAHVEVVCPGMLEILSVGKGDIKLVIDGNNPDDVNDARKVIEEMLRKGYGIFVETDKGLSRVKKFNPKRMTYVVAEVVDEPAAEPAPATKTTRKAPTRPRTRDRDVPVAGSRAKAIGRTAGG